MPDSSGGVAKMTASPPAPSFQSVCQLTVVSRCEPEEVAVGRVVDRLEAPHIYASSKTVIE